MTVSSGFRAETHVTQKKNRKRNFSDYVQGVHQKCARSDEEAVTANKVANNLQLPRAVP